MGRAASQGLVFGISVLNSVLIFFFFSLANVLNRVSFLGKFLKQGMVLGKTS